jgi:hypothetical protein
VLVCRSCFREDVPSIMQKREEREKKQILAEARRQLTCAGCQKRLPMSGPRWWGCKRCRKECRSSFHPQWARSAEA